MPDIIKEILKTLPEGVVSDSSYEVANIVLYTKNKDFFINPDEYIKKAVNLFKKRIELRIDPEILIAPEEAEKIIKTIVPTEAGITAIFFDTQRSICYIEAEKPGLVIGKEGENLKEIKGKTLWIPIVKRTPPLKSKIIEDIRSVLYRYSDYRRKLLNRIGHRIYDGWIRERREKWVRLTFFGAGRQVGRSCLFFQTPESRLLLDCGINMAAPNSDAYPILNVPEFNVKELDGVIITHAHLDHSGFVPYLFKFGYNGPVYCTEPTRDVTALLMLDYIKIMRSEKREPIYELDDVKEFVKHCVTLNWEEVMDITPDIRLTFYNSGHILGSCLVHLNVGNGLHNFVYTADVKFGRTVMLDQAVSTFARLETLCIESTYGGKENVMPPQKEQDKILQEIIKNTIERGGRVLMPVLGSGRAQEMMILIEEAIRNKFIPEVPVYIDGLVWDITAIHTAYPEFLNAKLRRMIFKKEQNPFLNPIFKRVGSAKERQQVIEETGPCIIIATSGMLVGGPSVEYLRYLADNPKNTLIFSCYQAEGSLGRRILEGLKELTFKNGTKVEVTPLKMEIFKIEITDHSDRKQLINYIFNCSPKPKKIVIQHGESSRALDLASSIYRLTKIETIVPRNLETIRLR